MAKKLTDEEKIDRYNKASKYRQKWCKENKVRVYFSLNKNKDAEIIEHLNSKENKNAYLKSLIIKDMEGRYKIG